MKKIPVDGAPAGPVMDAAVAEALGREPCDAWERVHHAPPIYMKDPDTCHHKNCYPAEMGVPPYSTDIAVAWEMESVLEVDAQADYVMALFNLVTDLDWGLHGFREAVFWGLAHATPLDRCRAFLKANGVTEIEMDVTGRMKGEGDALEGKKISRNRG